MAPQKKKKKKSVSEDRDVPENNRDREAINREDNNLHKITPTKIIITRKRRHYCTILVFDPSLYANVHRILKAKIFTKF